MTLFHPVTGLELSDDLAALEEIERRVDAFCRRQGVHYEFRRALRERIAELRGPAELPRPRLRSQKQERVAACPRCGAKNEWFVAKERAT